MRAAVVFFWRHGIELVHVHVISDCGYMLIRFKARAAKAVPTDISDQGEKRRDRGETPGRTKAKQTVQFGAQSGRCIRSVGRSFGRCVSCRGLSRLQLPPSLFFRPRARRSTILLVVKTADDHSFPFINRIKNCPWSLVPLCY